VHVSAKCLAESGGWLLGAGLDALPPPRISCPRLRGRRGHARRRLQLPALPCRLRARGLRRRAAAEVRQRRRVRAAVRQRGQVRRRRQVRLHGHRLQGRHLLRRRWVAGVVLRLAGVGAGGWPQRCAAAAPSPPWPDPPFAPPRPQPPARRAPTAAPATKPQRPATAPAPASAAPPARSSVSGRGSRGLAPARQSITPLLGRRPACGLSAPPKPQSPRPETPAPTRAVTCNPTCKNGGTCLEDGACRCPAGYTGMSCATRSADGGSEQPANGWVATGGPAFSLAPPCGAPARALLRRPTARAPPPRPLTFILSGRGRAVWHAPHRHHRHRPRRPRRRQGNLQGTGAAGGRREQSLARAPAPEQQQRKPGAPAVHPAAAGAQTLLSFPPSSPFLPRRCPSKTTTPKGLP
jgi:hypothetical protein